MEPTDWFDSSPPSPYLGFNLNLHPSASDMTMKAETGNLVDELKKMNSENKKLTEILTVISEQFAFLHNHMMELMTKNTNANQTTDFDATVRKRKADATDCHSGFCTSRQSCDHSCISEDFCSCKRQRLLNAKPKISRVLIRVERSNNSMVQRSVEDPQILVATYEGEHNHDQPSKADHVRLASTHASDVSNSSMSNNCLGQLQLNSSNNPGVGAHSSASSLHTLLTDQMVSSLTGDPSFTAALAAAISGNVLNQTHSDRRVI
ncbi:hypothetical protein Ancab_023274 [Ancistrocladus abbreviatus]